jgi:NTP pyrophosphatase (non-canonical NTP hydrolase)
MLIAEYLAFVGRTDSAPRRTKNAKEVAIYGLAGEIGSLVAALKRRLLSDGRTHWNVPNPQIIEEMGDCLWYLFALGSAHGIDADFLITDVQNLQAEVGGQCDRSVRIRGLLGDKADEFLRAAPGFLHACRGSVATLDDYRRLAYLTRRTEDALLVEVCVAVLQQLAAELFRTMLPDIEKELNAQIKSRDFEMILGETAWHLAALASLYQLTLEEVATQNIAKVTRRYDRVALPLPDEKAPADQRLPRNFSVAFVPVGVGRSRMYLDGSRLGDDLTDNAYIEDGYRFHDVMHLALAAKLGWSPVLRKLMKKKRKSNPAVDEVEDGARAQIVEEALVNAIHAEGRRLVALKPDEAGAERQPFSNEGEISFALLRSLDHFVQNLEVKNCGYWQWEEAIIQGYALFNQLRVNRRGTVFVDLIERSIVFSQHVLIDMRGVVAGIGLASATELTLDMSMTTDEQSLAIEHGREAVLCRKLAALRALGLGAPQFGEIEIACWKGDVADVRLSSGTQYTAWDRGIVAFKITVADVNGCAIATAIALADPELGN